MLANKLWKRSKTSIAQKTCQRPARAPQGSKTSMRAQTCPRCAWPRRAGILRRPGTLLPLLGLGANQHRGWRQEHK
eukprot:11698089-Alexandrium_andersonii.AAC.1